MPFKFERLSIPGIILIEPTVYKDGRGFFMETYKFSEFTAFGISNRFVQENHSKSTHGVLRGLHYQKKQKAQGKLIQIIHGEVFDVAVDIRKGSPTYSRWVGVKLSAGRNHLLYIPDGFAHGFCVLSEMAEVLYKVSEEYSPEHEGGIIWNDPDTAISWPIQDPILSKKDAAYTRLKEIDTGFIYKETG